MVKYNQDTNMKKIPLTFKAFLLSVTLFGFSCSALAATIVLSPSSKTVTAGQTFTVDILVDTQGADVDGVDVYSLNYNPSILEVVDASTAISGVQISSGSLLAVTLTNLVSGGTIKFSQVSSGGTSYNGSGKLATITFKALASGTSAATFDFTPGSTSDSNVAGSGQDKLTSVQNGSYTVTGGSPPPPPPPPLPNSDITPPVISSVSSSAIKSTSASILWTTNEISDSKVEYGLTSSYGSVTNTNSSLLTLHSQNLTGLKPNTLYHFRVISKDVAGNSASSNDSTFTTTVATATTPPPTSTPTPTPKSPTPTPTPTQPKPPVNTGTVTERRFPILSAIYASVNSTSSATVTWTTNEPADSQVQYGLTDNYELSTGLDMSPVNTHSQTIYGLSPATKYHFRVRSRNDLGNLSFSDDKTFTTLRESKLSLFERFISWLIALFRSIFG